MLTVLALGLAVGVILALTDADAGAGAGILAVRPARPGLTYALLASGSCAQRDSPFPVRRHER